MHFPKDFLQHVRPNPGFSESTFLAAHEQPAPTSIRYNPLKKTPETCTDPVPWCTNGCYLTERPIFAHDPLFHAGAYYVQEASSMFLDTILRALHADEKSQRILDLCAAPGGKSTLIAACMHPESVLCSNEVIKSRTHALKENLTKWGTAQVVITQNDAEDFGALGPVFDIVVSDAPCSGSGMFRKDPTAMQSWSLEHVTHCSKRQERIVQDIIPAIKPGGWLIYSTCSYAYEENESIVDMLVAKGWTCLQNISLHNGIVASSNGFRFYPDKVNGEGFFIAAIQKPMEDAQEIHAGSDSVKPCTTDEIALLKNWLRNDSNASCFWVKEHLCLLTDNVRKLLPTLAHLHIIQCGINIGEIKNKTLAPDHALAMSDFIHPDIPRIEVNSTVALNYIRKNTIQIENIPQGWALIQFQGLVLGWIKSIPGRINNYYPTEWRLRK